MTASLLYRESWIFKGPCLSVSTFNRADNMCQPNLEGSSGCVCLLFFLSQAAQSWPYKDSSWPDHTFVPESMEAKAKTGAPAPKAASKAEKKEPAAPRKADPAPAAPEPEHPPPQDGAAEAEAAAAAAGDEAVACGTDSLEHLKPFLIGGAVIAAGAILLGVLLLARRN